MKFGQRRDEHIIYVARDVCSYIMNEHMTLRRCRWNRTITSLVVEWSVVMHDVDPAVFGTLIHAVVVPTK